MHTDTACIFVDGENLRHSLMELFPTEFQKADYLPRDADWEGFFDHLVEIAEANRRLRTYWYVVDEIEFFPFGSWRKNPAFMQTVLSRHASFAKELRGISDSVARAKRADELAELVVAEERKITNRFNGWRQVQIGIANKFDGIEFRRAGSIRYNLFQRYLGKEKEVDVALATDLLQLRNIYETAIIVSGDQDYIPAVRAVKDSGKHVINVSFRERGGRLLPGGARRLNTITDRTIEMDYVGAMNFMKLTPKPIPSTAASTSTPSRTP